MRKTHHDNITCTHFCMLQKIGHRCIWHESTTAAHIIILNTLNHVFHRGGNTTLRARPSNTNVLSFAKQTQYHCISDPGYIGSALGIQPTTSSTLKSSTLPTELVLLGSALIQYNTISTLLTWL